MSREGDKQFTPVEGPSAQAGAFVVVPSYNHAPFIATTLRSIMKQTAAPLELLVIDDGSTDDSPRIAGQVLKDCPFPCELIVRENRGLCATLNEGLSRSKGRYFAYLGSDDIWLGDFLKSRTSLLEERPGAALAYGHAFLIDEKDHVIDCTADWANYADGDAREMLLTTIGPMSPTVLYRREILGKYGWNEEARLEDYELYLRLSAEGEFALANGVLSAWRQHGSNTSRDQTFMLEEQFRAQRRAAASLGVGANELDRMQRAIRFARAEDFLRLGAKAQAFSLAIRNLRGASSAKLAARIIARLAIPSSLMKRRKERRRKQARERYGSIRI